MSVATSTAIAIGLGAAGIAGAGISASAAGHAASTQANAADQAAQLQYQLGQQNLGFQEQQYRNSLGLLEPYYNTGTQSLGTLAQLMGLNPTPGNTSIFQNPTGQTINGESVPFNPNAPGWAQGDWTGTGRARMMALGNENGALGPDANLGLPSDFSLPPGQAPGSPVAMNGQPASLAVPASGAPGTPGTAAGTNLPIGYLNQTFDQQFTPPTGLTETNDPGYQARLKLATDQLQNSAAARGGLLSGGTAKALDQFSQDYASNEYGNVYNRALTNYDTAFNTFNANRSNLFNRYASLAGIGQTSAQQLSNAGLSTGSNVGSTLLNLGGQIGGDIQNAAAARASGYVGAGNAISGGINGITNLALLQQILGGGGSNPLGLSTNDPALSSFYGGANPFS